MTQPSHRHPPTPAGHGRRTYRQLVFGAGLTSFEVVCQQTDLLVRADRPLEAQTRERVLELRGQIEGYIRRYPDFATTLVPWRADALAPEIVRNMIRAGNAAGVGPMAAVAGAIAGSVGRHLLEHSRQVVVENGGDIFLKTDRPAIAGLYAGHSPLSMKFGIQVAETGDGVGVCTSSGTVGHSLSTGRADAVCVVAHSCALADAAATAIANRINAPDEIASAISIGRSIVGVLGIVAVCGREMGAWGQVELVPMQGKKG
ncbi:UPF0280 family protein [uncultured Desulfosarcina sp.]|uniref:UPF0280 family protein n=1 Tax=uncultured Desulfosarcina sp. TaxID=218289 RepID=UPI0029C7C2DE|nr:UPF0280 family protein [uncultured Desulfosarcina sp.]